ncbi:hypothetical protein [Sneathiella glossodoripedis]|uniref:hypothetical protein n=1 Tax=Sneathiella glossodoripedis TaxID=418853 RepID=UPI0004709802|nr:hypothetical protein [Sneathiella glossodoripedis]
MAAKRKRIIRKFAICGVVCVTVTGCAETIIAGMTIMDLFTAGSLTSTFLTGKGLGEHAMDAVTGQDCRILEGVFRSDRAICEPEGSVATKDDFKGIVALLDTPAGSDIQLAELPLDSSRFPEIDATVTKNAPELLKTLNKNNVVSIAGHDLIADNRHMHLIKATKDYTKPTTMVTPVGKQELRDRLTSTGLF